MGESKYFFIQMIGTGSLYTDAYQYVPDIMKKLMNTKKKIDTTCYIHYFA